MRYRAKIEVSLKPGTTDPEGNTTRSLLKELGYNVSEVGVSKVYTIRLEATSVGEAKAKSEEIAKRLLANPTKDDFTMIVEEQR